MRRSWLRRRSGVPGFGLTLGVTLSILSLVVLIPLCAVVIKSASLSPREFVAVAFSERAMAAYRLTFFASLAAAGINGITMITDFGYFSAGITDAFPPAKPVVEFLLGRLG